MPQREPAALVARELPVAREHVLGWGEAWRSVTELDLCLYLLERALVAHAGLTPMHQGRGPASVDAEWLAAYA